MHDQIAATGAPELLLARYDGPARVPRSLPPRAARCRTCSAGLVDAGEANELLAAEGHTGLRLVDNGEIGPERTRST